MKKKHLLIAVAAIVTVIIATASVLSFATNNGKADSKYKQILELINNDKTLSKEDRDEAKQLLDTMPQWFLGPLDANDEDEKLSDNFDSYNIIVKYLIQLMKNNPDKEKICLGVDIYSKEDIRLWDAADDGGVLDITQEVGQALIDIEEAFSKLGYCFDAIRIKDGAISFDTVDGQYSLIYKLDDNVDLNEKYKNDDSVTIIESNKDNWYHKFVG